MVNKITLMAEVHELTMRDINRECELNHCSISDFIEHAVMNYCSYLQTNRVVNSLGVDADAKADVVRRWAELKFMHKVKL